MKAGMPITIKNLSLPYIKKTVNLQLDRKLNYIKGDNGTGKTLLLDYISGIRKEKQASIEGNSSIIYINQSIFFSDRLTCKDFLRFIYRMEGGSKKLFEFWTFVGIFFNQSWNKKDVEDLLKKQWGMLSGGEKKFIYIIILLSINREWYILDEPFAFLDTSKKSIIWRMIDERLSEGKGIILTSHEEEIDYISNSANIINMNLLSD